jgi:hypothetical protein
VQTGVIAPVYSLPKRQATPKMLMMAQPMASRQIQELLPCSVQGWLLPGESVS